MKTRAQWAATLQTLQWTRGLRAGVAVSGAMIACHLLGKPMGWAALGGFETILVDNGGPYRSRLATMATLMAAGSVACIVASMTTPLLLACVVAAAFCFAVTFARVLSQPIASTSVIILVLYFAGAGSSDHTFVGALGNAISFVLGGAWAAALSLVLWPVDPFRPARLAVAECYRQLAEFTAGLHPTPPHSSERDATRLRVHAFQRTVRLKIEAARAALGATSARSPSRTVRARNLTVLLETADMLFAETLRWTELLEQASANDANEAARQALEEALHWLSSAEKAVVTGLERRPQDGAASYTPEGSHSLEHLRGRAAIAAYEQAAPEALLAHLGAGQRDALQNIEIAFEAIYSIWSGTEVRAARSLQLHDTTEAGRDTSRWLPIDVVRSNWTVHSVMMRHALRIAVVAAVDVLLIHTLHIGHGFWLAMTSIIVLQPYGSGTLRKGMQRVGGTIAGGVLAAILAASIHNQAGIIAVIALTSIMTLATYAVDYGWYTFFLTPTFVLMSLPYLRDWRYAGVRMGTTVLGAVIAVLAMRLLWPEREGVQLGRLLARAVAANAEYLRAMLHYWRSVHESGSSADRQRTERELLAPARRNAGLTLLDAEETLDRMMLEPDLGLRNTTSDGRAEALTVITYLRRLGRSTTMLASVDAVNEAATPRMERLAQRLDVLSATLLGTAGNMLPTTQSITGDIPLAATISEQQMRRMERQVGVLERAAATLSTASSQ